MAQALIEFYNATTGGPQISSSANSLVYVSKGSASSFTNKSNSPIGQRCYIFVPCSRTAIIAWAPTTANRWSNLGGRYDANAGGRYVYMNVTLLNEAFIDYFIFDKPSAMNTTDLKFEVYNEFTGEVAWQLYANTLKVVRKIGLVGDITVPAGKRYAGIVGMPYIHRYDQLAPRGGIDEDYYIGVADHAGLAINGSTFNYGMGRFDQGTISHKGEQEGYYLGTPSMLVVDVTGL